MNRKILAAKLQIAGAMVESQKKYGLSDQEMLEVLERQAASWKEKIENGGGADEGTG